MKKMKHTLKTNYLLICTILVFLLLPSLAFGATYYVCDDGTVANAGEGSGWSTGSNTNSGLSRTTAWKTIQKAANTMVAGDTVIASDGTYTAGEGENTFDSIVYETTDGDSENFITYQAENTHGAVLDGEASARARGFYLY